MYSHSRTAPGYLGPARLLIVAAAHALALWVIAGALNVRLPATLDTILQVENVENAPLVTVDRPPLVPNGLNALRREVEPVEPAVPIITDVGDDAMTAPPTDAAGADDARMPPAQPLLVGARIDPQHPLTQPDYPPASIRFSEQGVLELDLHVAADGRVMEARVWRSSGFARLDAAAVAEALRAWRLLPATRNGAAIDSWRRQRVNFQLKDLR